MTMELIPPTLDDMGHVLWGANWREYLANVLEVTEDEVEMWETEPSRRPANLEDDLQKIGDSRIQEIAIMLAQLKETGLRGPAS